MINDGCKWTVVNYMKNDRLNKQLFAQLSDKIIAEVKKELERGANKIVTDAKQKCPVKTGNLRDSIHAESKNDGLKYNIVADAKSTSGAYYGRIVEFSPKINKPYLYPSMDANKKPILDNIARVIEKICEKEKK